MDMHRSPCTVNKQGKLSPASGKMMEQTIGNALAAIAKLRLQGQLCDVVLRVDDVEFRAHKIILSGCSSYFCILFTGAYATSEKQKHTIPGVSPEIMHLIIDYAYTHSVAVTADNVEAVLEAADQFLIPGMVQACWSFLESQLCLENCIGIWRLLDFYYYPEFKHKMFFYVLHHFEDIVSISQEFLDLSVDQLVALIESDHLSVKQENAVVEPVLQWINHLPDQRQEHLSTLLSKMRLGLLTADYLDDKLANNTMIRNCPDYRSIINEAFDASPDFCTRRQDSVSSNLLRRPRLPPVNLLVTGGKSNLNIHGDFELHDTRTGCWNNLGNSTQVAFHGAATVGGYVYIVGGCKPGSHLNTVKRFDFTSFTWNNVASMQSPRSHLSVAVQDGRIYAMGGFNGVTCLNTAECYNPEYDRWTRIGSMRARRCGASATSLLGKVYICGGYNGQFINFTAESYNPETNQWSIICPMNSSRTNLGVIASKGRIFAVGGESRWYCHLSSAEAYDPNTNRWCMVPPMSNQRSSFGIEVVEDKLFVVGGQRMSLCLKTVECYDEAAGRWKLDSQIGTPRAGPSCCLLHGAQHLMEGLFPRGSAKLPKWKEDQSDPQPSYFKSFSMAL